MKDRGKYSLTKREVAMGITIGYSVLFFLFYLFYHSFLLAMASGVLLLFCKRPYEDYLEVKRKNLLRLQFKDFLYGLSSAIAVGAPLMEAMEMIGSQLKVMYKEESPMIKELNYMVKSFKESRQSEEELLVDFARRNQIEDISNFVDVYLACRTIGGDLGKIVNNATLIIMDKMDIEKDIRTLTAQKQFEGKIITVMPIGVIFALNIFYPDYLQILYVTTSGRLIMTLALGGIGLAFYLTLRLTRIKV